MKGDDQSRSGVLICWGSAGVVGLSRGGTIIRNYDLVRSGQSAPPGARDQMTIELLSLRALVVSPDEGLRDLFRQAAASLSVPVEIVDVASAAECRSAAGVGVDLAYLDAALHLAELARATAALRAVGKPPFTVQLAASASTQSFETDGLAGRPSRFEEAKWLLDRSMRVRLPSQVLIVDDSATMRGIVRKISRRRVSRSK
jgi:hypothetical protein